jgi:P-type Cu2+ transporter
VAWLRTCSPRAEESQTVLHVVADGRVLGALALEDEIRPESKDAVDSLHELGLTVPMITGDARAVADSVARRLGIDEVAAQILPSEKASAVERFQQPGRRRVAMVGDGVNDAPALATADVGIAIGAGTDVAIESAGLVLVSNDPRDVVAAIQPSRASYRRMIANLFGRRATTWWPSPRRRDPGALGFVLPMAAAAVAMSASTIIVAANAQLLRRVDLRPSPRQATRRRR